MNAIESFLPTAVIENLGWVLVHFTWQATALALLLAAVLRTLRAASAKARYAVACQALALMALAPMATLATIAKDAGDTQRHTSGTRDRRTGSPVTRAAWIGDRRPPPVEEFLPSPQGVRSGSVSWRESIGRAIEPALPWTVLAWALGVVVLSAGNVGGWIQIQLLIRRKVRPLSVAWQQRLAALARKMSLRRKVRYFESFVMEVPAAVGWLRPVVLIPASALAGVQPDLLEAVLLHELAHIRRHDYLVNLLQMAVETLGFFHPAVWWVSRRIRFEREHCCDDAAVEALGDRPQFARALVRLEETRHEAPRMALAGNGGVLVQRIARLLSASAPQGRGSSCVGALVIPVLALLLPLSIVLRGMQAQSTSENEMAGLASPKTRMVKQRLSEFGGVLLAYAAKHEGQLPKELEDLRQWPQIPPLAPWLRRDVAYLGAGRKANDGREEPLAADLSMLADAGGAWVLRADGNVGFLAVERLRELEVVARSPVEVLEVTFEPVGVGKCIAHVRAKNTAAKAAVLGVWAQTRSPQDGDTGFGWGRSYYRQMTAGEEASLRVPFLFHEPLTDAAWVRLRFYDPAATGEIHFSKPCSTALTREVGQLERRQTRAMQQASDLGRAAAIEALRRVQSQLQKKDYASAIGQFTQDYRAIWSLTTADKLKEQMEPPSGVNPWSWQAEEFLALEPESASAADGLLSLCARHGGQTWTIDLVREEGQWKIDWVAGYVPAAFGWPDWTDRLLPKTQKRSTDHFDIYYFQGSTAERDVEQIAKLREEGYVSLCRFLGTDANTRIRLVLFEDGRTKFRETGHQGDGWAFEQTIVEVYNAGTRLDPYHELAHILLDPLGRPPAVFTEGFAVYMSERLGAPPLAYLGGGNSSLEERVRELKRTNQWIQLEELLTYTEIGSEASRPAVSYAESGALVRYLVERFGKDRFLAAYKALRSSSDPSQHRRNEEQLQRIYGRSVLELERDWEGAFAGAR